ncbi:lysylphosphatidylglycerol synthase domain-containing protein [Novipirellula artificiosorum]|uniref:Flippase-like domain-containing protein n=1 Tax=Novipirellula artificiosorum TaxID=2528016 RepID=A0A5C6D7R2_9BACT|nr:lysylphosphatidylglycerol synthase domain-containing protein [Novipirellula artificiosorum]TWU32860.1 hypothetical protein Poly41_52370 [Novipirellula artificiosorum]
MHANELNSTSDPGTTDDYPSGGNKNRTLSRIKTVAKWIIAVVVVVGLILATRSAIDQWKRETAKVRERIVELDAKVASSKDRKAIAEWTRERQSLARSIPSLANLRWSRVAVAAAFYALGLLPSAMVLAGWLAVLGFRPPILLAIAAQTLGHIGKYVPGKAMVVVVRAGVLAKYSIPIVPATLSVFLETFMMMAVGAAVAGVVICWLPVPNWMLAAAVAGSIAASLPTLPPVLRQVTSRLLGKDSHLGKQAWRACLQGWAWSILSWLLIGSSFAMLITAIPESGLSDPRPPISGAMLWAVATAAISLAMVIGFASLLPGGAGVRELVLTTILAFAVGPTHALLAAIMARLVFIAVECVMALAAWAYVNRHFSPQREVGFTAA